jgi:hypothetical protein
MAEGSGSALKQFRHLALEKFKWVTYIVSALVILSLTIVVFSAEASENRDAMNRADDIRRILDSLGGPPRVDPKVIAKYVDTTEEKDTDGNLPQGSSSETVVLATPQKVVTSIKARLTWTDESDPPGIRLRRYQNEPDTFTLTLLSPNGTIMDEVTGSSGSLSVGRDMKEEEVLTLFGTGNFTVVVRMDSTGDWYPRFGPGIPLDDPGNDFSLVTTIGYKVDPETL